MAAKKAWVEKTPPLPLGDGAPEETAGFPLGITPPDFLKNFSLATALRQLLWAGSIFSSIFGIMLAVSGTAAVWYALGMMHNSLVAPIDNIAAGVGDAADAMAPIQDGVGGFGNTTSTIAASLRNFSSASAGVGESLRGLASIPAIGSSLSGLSDAADKIEGAGGGLSSAADQLDNTGNNGVVAAAAIGKVRVDLGAAKESILAAKDGIGSAFGMAQMGVLVGGFALCVLFCSTLLLALSTGVPKRI